VIQDRDPGDETDRHSPMTLDGYNNKLAPRASDALEAKAAALVALIGTVGTVSSKALENMMIHQRQMHQERLKRTA